MLWGITQARPARSDPLFERGFDERIQVAVQHFLGVGNFNVGAQIFDSTLVQHVAANLMTPTHIGFGVF